MLQPILGFFIAKKCKKIRLSLNRESYLHLRMENQYWRGGITVFLKRVPCETLPQTNLFVYSFSSILSKHASKQNFKSKYAEECVIFLEKYRPALCSQTPSLRRIFKLNFSYLNICPSNKEKILTY